MIEIALSLAVIGFALVAIIGILPAAMEVQRENREETMINQDASVFLDAIRSGAQGMDDLTNYVIGITNYVTEYTAGGPSGSYVLGFTTTTSTKNGGVTSPVFALTNGYRIIGLLSTPKYQLITNGANVGYSSNYVVAFMRALSGPASDKAPQKNASMQDLAFSYRMIADVVPYASYDFNWTNYTAVPTNSPEYPVRQSFFNLAKNMQNNLFDVRLAFRFPLLGNGGSGNGRLDSRSLVSGTMTNDLTVPEFPIFFFQPRTYVKAP
jgi:type II secretory pathway pseudopilin PulG